MNMVCCAVHRPRRTFQFTANAAQVGMKVGTPVGMDERKSLARTEDDVREQIRVGFLPPLAGLGWRCDLLPGAYAPGYVLLAPCGAQERLTRHSALPPPSLILEVQRDSPSRGDGAVHVFGILIGDTHPADGA